MSLTLSVFFEPSAKMKDAKDLVNAINAKISGMAEYDEEVGSCDINCYWPCYIIYPSFYSYFAYAEMSFQAYWNDVLNGIELRQLIKTVCEALGANEWWYIEETSMDFIYDLNKNEFEELILKAPDIENFETPTYFPASKNHFFHDSSQQVASYQTITQ